MKIASFLILFSLSFPFVVRAQDDTAADWSFRVGFLSSTVPVNDFAAEDSVRLQLYIAPQFSITHKSGLGVILRSYFLTGGTASGNFLTTFTPNFEKDNSKLYLGANYTHFFYKKNTDVPYTPINNELYGNIRLKTKILQPLLVLDGGWGKDSTASTVFDLNILAGVAHEFSLKTGDDGSLSLLPAIILNAGTNSYFSLLSGSPYIGNSKNYKAVIHGKGSSRGNSSGGNNPGAMPATTNSLELRQLEANLYIYYSIGKITIEPDASIFFPLQTGDNVSGYFQLNVNFNF